MPEYEALPQRGSIWKGCAWALLAGLVVGAVGGLALFTLAQLFRDYALDPANFKRVGRHRAGSWVYGLFVITGALTGVVPCYLGRLVTPHRLLHAIAAVSAAATAAVVGLALAYANIDPLATRLQWMLWIGASAAFAGALMRLSKSA